MRYWTIWQWLAVLKKKLQRAYRYSELRKLQLWLKGKTLHPALYLVSATLLVGVLVGLHHYCSHFFYVVTLEGREVGMVRDAGEIDDFLVELKECCSSFYGMAVEPEQDIFYNREYRSGGEEDAFNVKENLRQQINLVTKAVMLTVDQVPAVPVVSEKEVGQVIELLCSAYTSDSENVRLLKVNLVEDIAGTPCTISPEAVCVPQEAASLLLNSEESHESRLLLASRYDETLRENEPPELAGFLPEVHVRTLEEVRAVESIPFDTNYTYNDKMWHAQSHVLVPGKAGEKEVTYHVTSENGKEIDRQIVEQTVLLEPVTQVVEKGTSRAPSIGTGLFVWPVADGGIVSQHFSGAHKGIDITMLGHRSPILAADSGVVVETGSGDRRGNYIVIYHGSYYTAYLHNSINYVSTGATVSRGQTIAQMGNTGRTFGRTGIHLHFEIRRSNGSTIWNSTAINPLTFF